MDTETVFVKPEPGISFTSDNEDETSNDYVSENLQIKDETPLISEISVKIEPDVDEHQWNSQEQPGDNIPPTHEATVSTDQQSFYDDNYCNPLQLSNGTLKTTRPTFKQLEALGDFLSANPGISKGVLRSALGKQQTKRKWKEVAGSLNSLGGAQKDGKGWAKYWADKKCALKKTCAQHAQTTGCANSMPTLSPIDQRLVAVMGGPQFAARENHVFISSTNQPPESEDVADDDVTLVGRYTPSPVREVHAECVKGIIIPHHFLTLTTFSNEKKHCCHICNKEFATNSTLQRHLVLHTRTKHTCHICKKQFNKKELLDTHLAKHDTKNERLYPCDECEKKFKSSSNLMQHKRIHLNIKPFGCDVCKRAFVHKGNLVKHQMKTRCQKPSDEPLICNVCHKVFSKAFLLRSHLKKHDTERPFTCDLCGMSFKYKSTIIRHLQWHTGHRPYKCKFCNKKFTHSGLLKPHLRVHTGEKPYQCSICLKFFAHKHNMERHKINHGRIKRLICEVCNKRFPRESRLIYHMRTHTNEKHFACHLCAKRFSHKQNILRHYEKKHPGFQYLGTETDAKVALKVWDKVKHNFEPQYDLHQTEEILG